MWGIDYLTFHPLLSTITFREIYALLFLQGYVYNARMYNARIDKELVLL